MIEFFRKLFDTSDFPARWNCGVWTSGHGWLHILSDIGVWGAYTTIPIVLAYFVLRRRDIPFPRIFILFALFILACGTTHLIESLIFWWPIYRVSGLAKLGTAIVSWATVVALIPIMPKALALPRLAKINEQLTDEVAARAATESALRESEQRLRAVIETAVDGIITIDEQGRVRSMNPAAVRLFDYQADEVIGKNVKMLMPEPFHGEHDGYLQNYLRTGEKKIIGIGREVLGRRKDGSMFPMELAVSETALQDGRRLFTGIVRDITDRKRMEERQHLMMGELSHRVKNTLATVQSIATQTMQFSDSFETFRKSFEDRLQSLSIAHSLLTGGQWQGAELRDIVRRELQPHITGDTRVRIAGPNVLLRPKAALALHMVLHELMTNAAKYGALSTDCGNVEVRWDICDTPDESEELVIRWLERGGPAVEPPTRRGFGSQVVEAAVAYELDGAASVQYQRDGVSAEIRVPWSQDVGRLASVLPA